MAERASFAEAARSLRVSATAVSRAVAQLESQLGVLLLRRTTRSVALTPEGEAFLERVRGALEALEDAERMVRGEDAAPRGLLVVSAPVVFGRLHALPIVAGLLASHPALKARLDLSDRNARLAEDGVDVAVRIGALADSALIAQRVWRVSRVLLASPDYLARRGVPADLADLASHDLVAFEPFTTGGEWRFGGDSKPVAVMPRLAVTTAEAAIDAAASGLGIARVFDYQAAERLAAGALVRVLKAVEPAPDPVSLVYQARRSRDPNVRAFAEAARAYFAAR